ncbi:unnamed protein product [Ectocarpus sp. 12 AP-2014]
MSSAIVFDFGLLRFLCRMSELWDNEVIGSRCAARWPRQEKSRSMSGFEVARMYVCMCKLGLVE